MNLPIKLLRFFEEFLFFSHSKPTTTRWAHKYTTWHPSESVRTKKDSEKEKVNIITGLFPLNNEHRANIFSKGKCPRIVEKFLWHSYIISNCWIRFSMISRTIQTLVSDLGIILDIMRKPSSIVVLLFTLTIWKITKPYQYKTFFNPSLICFCQTFIQVRLA